MNKINLIFDNDYYDNNESKSFEFEQFRSNNWNELSSKEKIQLLQDFGNIRSDEIGLSNFPTIVEEKRHDNVYGIHYYATNTITVNLDNCSNPYQAMDTVVHEINHAYQHQCISTGTGYSEGERALMHAQIGPAYCDVGPGYDIQTIELDSNNAAANYVIENCSNMKDDPMFYAYVSDRVEHFDNVNDVLDFKKGFCDTLEADQVNIAYTYDVLSYDERNAALNYIAQNEFDARLECAEIKEKMEDVHYESALEYSKTLNEKYNEFDAAGKDKKLALNIKGENETCIDVMSRGMGKLDNEIQIKKDEQREYIVSNNLGIMEASRDEKCIAFANELKELESQRGQYNYHITELTTNSQLIDQKMGWNKDVNNTYCAREINTSEKNNNMDHGM